MTNHRSKVQILVVEDDVDIRESLVDLLEDNGYGVAQAGDGTEALAVLGGGGAQPDLIILDLMMPNMNGAQFREAQLQLADHASIPIVLTTADRNGRDKATELRANGFVQKPFKGRALLDVVRQVLAGGQASE